MLDTNSETSRTHFCFKKSVFVTFLDILKANFTHKRSHKSWSCEIRELLFDNLTDWQCWMHQESKQVLKNHPYIVVLFGQFLWQWVISKWICLSVFLACHTFLEICKKVTSKPYLVSNLRMTPSSKRYFSKESILKLFIRNLIWKRFASMNS